MQTDNIRILYVDDELNNLTSFKASFRRYFEIYTAESAVGGRRILEEKDIHIIITDQRMPNMTGIEFLESIREKYPDPIRILLTGYEDINAVIDSINKGQVFRYISKPWNEDELRGIILNAYEVYSLRKENSLFIFKVSHDLRAPLASIKGLINLAKSDFEDKEALQNYLNLIECSIGNFNKKVDELIDYKKFDLKRLSYSLINFQKLVDESIHDLKYIDPNHTIKFEISIDQQLIFKSDLSVLKSIFQNLIQNSIKYRRTDIEQSIISIKIESNEKWADIEVKDNGLGMTPEISNHLFNLFNKRGTGLGMYIVKSGIQNLEGTISFITEENEGTTFNFTVPNQLFKEKRYLQTLSSFQGAIKF